LDTINHDSQIFRKHLFTTLPF